MTGAVLVYAELMKKNEAIRNAKNFDEILDIQYGKIGEKKRDEF